MSKSETKQDQKIFSYLTLLFFLCCAMVEIKAQIDPPPKDAAPPPMVFIPKDERKRIEFEKDVKRRTQLSLDLTEIHLQKAEQFANVNEFQNSLNELGNLQAILENALQYLNDRKGAGSKVDDNFKRLEIGLRKTAPRLEVLRRAMPFNYGFYVQRVQKFVREVRAKALEPLFDNTVVPERKS